jgi:hypothetical protein
MRGRTIAKVLAVAGAVASVLSGVWAEDPALVSDGSRPELFLIYTGDVIGHVEPCG